METLELYKLLHYEKKILDIFLDFFILDTKMTCKNKTTKTLTTINSMLIPFETNNNKNLGVSERVHVLVTNFQLETNVITDDD